MNRNLSILVNIQNPLSSPLHIET